MPLSFHELMIHGRTVAHRVGASTPNEVDGTGGYLAVLPVAAGKIVAIEEAAAVSEPDAIAVLQS